MSDHTKQPSTDPSQLSPARRRFDAIYAFVEKQATTIMPVPQNPKPQQKRPDDPNTDPLSTPQLQQDQGEKGEDPSLRLQARKADFLEHDALLQRSGTPGSSID